MRLHSIRLNWRFFRQNLCIQNWPPTMNRRQFSQDKKLGGFGMSKILSLCVFLIIVLSLSACRVSKADIRKADEFIYKLSSFESADPVSDIDELADLSASIINLPVDAFDFDDVWEKKKGESEKYVVIFGADATLSVYFSSGKIYKVTYTFCADSAQDTQDSIDNLVSIYGEPESVSLNGEVSSHSEAEQATNIGDNPDFKYYYEWVTELQGLNISVYEAYYYGSGINFTYIVISKSKDNTVINKWWI